MNPPLLHNEQTSALASEVFIAVRQGEITDQEFKAYFDPFGEIDDAVVSVGFPSSTMYLPLVPEANCRCG